MAAMNNKKSILILSIIMIILESCKSWPSGAPEKTCPTLLPRHGGQPAKEANESPYMLEQSNSQYRPGDQILGKKLFFSHNVSFLICHSFISCIEITKQHTIQRIDRSSIGSGNGQKYF